MKRAGEDCRNGELIKNPQVIPGLSTRGYFPASSERSSRRRYFFFTLPRVLPHGRAAEKKFREVRPLAILDATERHARINFKTRYNSKTRSVLPRPRPDTPGARFGLHKSSLSLPISLFLPDRRSPVTARQRAGEAIDKSWSASRKLDGRRDVSMGYRVTFPG